MAANQDKINDMVAAAKSGDFSKIVEDAKAIGQNVGSDVKMEAATAVAPIAHNIEAKATEWGNTAAGVVNAADPANSVLSPAPAAAVAVPAPAVVAPAATVAAPAPVVPVAPAVVPAAPATLTPEKV